MNPVITVAESHASRLAQAVRDVMQKHNYSLSAIESCTGGLVASTLTDIPGSGYLHGSAVAYDPAVKQMFGVPEASIREYGVVSPQVALHLAECSARWFRTDFGLGVTGVAGPDAEDGLDPGTAFAAVWNRIRGGRVLPIQVDGDRKSVKAEIAQLTIGLLLDELENVSQRPSPMVEAWIGR